MPLTQTQSNESANAATNAVVVLANGGFLDWYNGAQPATADSPIGASTLLASLALSNPAFNAAVGGVATAKTIAPATGLATLTAQWFRVWKSDHTSPLGTAQNPFPLSGGYPLNPNQRVTLYVRNNNAAAIPPGVGLVLCGIKGWTYPME